MATSKKDGGTGGRWQKFPVQRRLNALVDHARPHRWNWSWLVRPLDRSLARQVARAPGATTVRNLRYFWLDGLFSAMSESFYLGFIPLFALAYGASNGQVGLLAALVNLAGAIALFPGARLVEQLGWRKPLVIGSAGLAGRFLLLFLALIPFLTREPVLAITLIVLADSARGFFNSLANPAWTSLVADLVPDVLRGRYFGSRNLAMGVAALVVAPLAGRIIAAGNAARSDAFVGYQLIFLLAFVFGLVSTANFQAIKEQAPAVGPVQRHHRGDLRHALRRQPAFIGLVISSFVWNMALQVAGPFFNVYLVTDFAATTTTIGLLAAVSSLTALIGHRLFGHLLDRKGAIWVQLLTGGLIPALPLAWVFITAPWQVAIINTFGGLLWAGYTLSNFNLLLALAPDDQRPRAVALYQMAVFFSAVAGPLLGGYLVDTLGFRVSFATSFAGRCLAMGLFFWLTVLPIRRRPEMA